MLDLTGKTAAVTGSGGGIGRDIALLFAEQGADVIVNSLREETGAAVCRRIRDEFGRRAAFVQGDAADSGTARAAARTAAEEFGGLDILVNNAGITVCGGAEEMSEEDFDLVVRTNIRSVFMMTKYAVPLLRARGGGAVVNLGSAVVFRGQPRRAAYAATKGAVAAMTRSLAADLLPDGIRVNCVCPGATYTEKMEERFLFEGGGDRVRGAEYFSRLQPLGRLAAGREIAAAVLYAASDEAAFMAGTCLVIDGGRTM